MKPLDQIPDADQIGLERFAPLRHGPAHGDDQAVLPDVEASLIGRPRVVRVDDVGRETAELQIDWQRRVSEQAPRSFKSIGLTDTEDVDSARFRRLLLTRFESASRPTIVQ